MESIRAKAKREMASLLPYRDFIFYQVYANLRSEAKRYYISYLWWVINPVVEMFVYYLVFGVVLKRGTKDFVPFLLIGIVSFRWLMTAVLRSANSIQLNAFLINQVYIPKAIIPTVIVLTETVKFFITFGILLFFLAAYGLPVTTHYVDLAFVLAIEFVFILGVSCLFSAVIPFFPDLIIVIQSGMQLLFFLSGVFFKIDAIPPQYRQWFYLNPMLSIIKNLRAILLYHQWPSFENLTYVLLLSLIILFTAYGIIRKFEKVYPRIVMS